jgi:hypothetical protein
MPQRWRITKTREIANAAAGGYDSDRAWEVDLEDIATGERRRVRFDVAGGRSNQLLDDSREVLRDRGRRFLRPFLHEDEPPKRIVLTTAGPRVADEEDAEAR